MCFVCKCMYVVHAAAARWHVMRWAVLLDSPLSIGTENIDAHWLLTIPVKAVAVQCNCVHVC